MVIYFENLSVGLYILYVHYYTCQILCQSNIIYYLIHTLIFLCIILDYKNLKFKYLIDDIVIAIDL